jgi:hypothetical protein
MNTDIFFNQEKKTLSPPPAHRLIPFFFYIDKLIIGPIKLVSNNFFFLYSISSRPIVAIFYILTQARIIIIIINVLYCNNIS